MVAGKLYSLHSENGRDSQRLLLVFGRGNVGLSDDWTYGTAVNFRGHLINLRFRFSEGSEVLLVV